MRAVPSEECSFCTSGGHHARSPVDRLANPRIGTTTTDVARHSLIDVVIARPRFFAQQHRRAHQLSRLTVPALRHVLGNPCTLQGMTQVRRQPLNGRHLLTSGPRYRRHARPYRLTIKVNRTSTTLRHAATVLGPGKPKVFPQDPEQRSGRIDVQIYALPVYAEGNHANTFVKSIEVAIV